MAQQPQQQQHSVPMIDRTVQETNIWLKDLAEELGTEDRREAYHALREVLVVTRDTLVPDEALDMASQLPTLIRGMFFEAYRVADKPNPKRHAEQFVHEVRRRLEAANQNVDPEAAIRAVFALLQRHLSPGQVKQVREMLHKEVQAMWPAAASEPH
jgi:uncharacterized protein (DUF2267 family)